jgi:signal transduction histidine kinase
MSFNIIERLKKQWGLVKSFVEIADSAFISLRSIIFFGALGWLVFSDISDETFRNVKNIFIYFISYSLFIYAWLFLNPQKKKIIYAFSLLFDLIYAFFLVSATGGFESSFFNAFYLITALYSFYYGLVPGTVIAAVALVLYYFSCGYRITELHWTDYMVRSAFLFLLAVPLGMLSQKLKSDKNKIEHLNKDLEGYIEELRNIQSKLIQVEKLSALGRLTADVAHEIRNPLTSIGGFARRLNKRLVPGSTEKKYAEIVVAEVDRLERILRDVLTFSRESRFEMEYQKVNNIISEALQTFSAICREYSINISESLDESLPESLIDKDQVRQAVNNLISNAIDVMSDGGSLSIKTYMERLNEVDYIVVEVSDTGPGLTQDSINMIFEPFFTTKEIGAGTGLGLSICKKIIDEHNGLIFVDSDLGVGTSFKMLFPYQAKEENEKIKCWEYTKCGVERAEGAAHFICPAYPGFGRVCWAVAGTFCGKKVNGAIAQKIGNCKKCEFYQRVAVRKDLN